MDPGRQALFVRDELEQAPQLVPLLGLQRGQDRLVMLAGDSADLTQLRSAFLGEVERVRATILSIFPTLHQPERLELIHDRHETAGVNSQDRSESLLAQATVSGKQSENPGMRSRQAKRAQPLPELRTRVSSHLSEQKCR